MTVAREYPYTRRDFDYLRRLSNERTGIVVTDDKFDMFYARLARRVRALGLADFAAYCRYLGQPANGAEIGELVNAITTNLTAFFREGHHFDYLAAEVLPELARRNRRSRRIRIWSAGCSTGEEAYSLAMVLAENEALLSGWDAGILASDIDTSVLAQAAAGIYPLARVDTLSRDRLRAFFQRGRGGQAGRVRTRDVLRRRVRFEQINLLQSPAVGPQDVIFCRNVLIYFDKDAKRRLVDDFADRLADGGYLFVGHAESLYQLSERFRLVGQTVYRKVG